MKALKLLYMLFVLVAIGCDLRPSTDVDAPTKAQLDSYQRTVEKQERCRTLKEQGKACPE